MPVWSPDGNEIAFRSEKDGVAKVWRMTSAGGTPRAFEQTLMSRNLAWAPGSKILYQRPGNRNFHFLDPRTEEETPLVKDESVGWVLDSEYSPDGSKVAVLWNRVCEGEQFLGVWSISVADGSEQLLARGNARPLRWSEDGNWVYARDEENHLVRIPASGGDPEILLTIPLEDARIEDITPDGSRMVVTVWESFSDLWLVDNFDPDVN